MEYKQQQEVRAAKVICEYLLISVTIGGATTVLAATDTLLVTYFGREKATGVPPGTLGPPIETTGLKGTPFVPDTTDGVRRGRRPDVRDSLLSRYVKLY
ncbi:hypothetical protein HNY73_022292 [Argiope bruennichi]|uniref:Uncharacterized protein n=1 Tax=Argiope bruennichi TaxID=94029 RepID=A0A8T0E2R9_ARGBR|nr:hypothetical protein HNY73_022292 [Argiope bruennichi]